MMNLYKSNLYKEAVNKVFDKIPRQSFSGKKILITGATGLIGSFLTDIFLMYNESVDEKNKITIYCVGRSEKKFTERFKKNSKNLVFLEQDIIKSIEIDDEINYIFHGASNADPETYAKYPVETITTNVIGTTNILDFARKKKKCKVIVMSTMEVYGSEISKFSYSETDFGKIDFNVIRSGYPESKRVTELLAGSYRNEYNVDVIIARLGYIYGPTMQKSDSKAIAQFLRNVLTGNDIYLKSPGKQLRSYCYVADAASALIKLLDSGVSGEAYNVSGADNITIKDLAELIAKTGNKKVIYENPSNLEVMGFSKPQNNVLNIEKLLDLKWTPEYSISDGIISTIKIMEEIK